MAVRRNRRQVMTKLKSLIVGLVALIAAITTVSDANAWGTTGTAVGQPAICAKRPAWRITVYPPSMYAVPLPRVRPDGTVIFGPTHYQWVAYRASVHRIANGRLYLAARGPWKRTLVNDEPWYEHGEWTNLTTGRVERGHGETVFNIGRRGSYVVQTDAHWYADEHVGAGGLIMGPSQYLAAWDWKNKPNCSYGVS
jgi:hypothetical protein